MAKTQATTETSEDQWDTHFNNGIPAVGAYLHQAIQVSGVPAERTISKLKLPGMLASWTPMGLLIKVGNKKITIPAANVANVLHP